MTEQELVVNQFNKAFGDLQEPVVLYGVGRNTAAILENSGKVDVVGLMDVETVGQTVYGKPVLSYDEVIDSSKIIIIVARQSVVNIIHKRIAFLSAKYGIKIYTVNGELINEQSSQYRNRDLGYWSVSKDELYGEIDSHDVISFDIFDTLIMRKTLIPEDVFELVEQEIEQRHQIVANFKELRKQSEAELPHVLSTFDEIYERFATLSGLSSDIVNIIKNTELEIETRSLISRNIMIDAFNYAKKAGKTLFLTSDMYLPHSFLVPVLASLNIKDYDSLLISSDLKKSKKDGALFTHLKSIAPSSNILHIGDNRIDDIEQAENSGIDTFFVMSAHEMLMASSLQDLLSDISNIQKRLYLGAFAARAFNNPFSLSLSKGVIHIDQIADLGYLFIAPLIIEFVRWLGKQLKDKGFDNVLFPSRDGFLINQIYSKLVRDNPKIPEGIYFKTSRRILNVATLSSEEEISFILEKTFKGTKRELLETRFGISLNPNADEHSDRVDAYTSSDELRDYTEPYQAEILENSRREGQLYRQYLKTLDIKPGKKYALFDFISSGTIPFFMEKLLDTELSSFFFASMNMPNELCSDMSKVNALYGNVTSYEQSNNIGKHYLFLESILVDPDATLSGFTEDLKPVFEAPSNNFWLDIKKVHDGIKDLLSDLQSLFYNHDLLRGCEAIQFADELLGYLFTENVDVEEWIKEIFKNDDKYSGELPYKAWV